MAAYERIQHQTAVRCPRQQWPPPKRGDNQGVRFKLVILRRAPGREPFLFWGRLDEAVIQRVE